MENCTWSIANHQRYISIDILKDSEKVDRWKLREDEKLEKKPELTIDY
jgi:hypothetical protein